MVRRAATQRSASSVRGAPDEEELTAAGLDLSPAMHWRAPVFVQRVDDDEGPVLVTVEYRIDPQDRAPFLAAMQEMLALRQELGGYEINSEERVLSRDELKDRVRGCDGIVCLLTDRIDAGLIGQAGAGMRLIANYGAGVDHIDVATARARGMRSAAEFARDHLDRLRQIGMRRQISHERGVGGSAVARGHEVVRDATDVAGARDTHGCHAVVLRHQAVHQRCSVGIGWCG